MNPESDQASQASGTPSPEEQPPCFRTPPGRMRRMLRSVLIAGVLSYLVWCGLLFFQQDAMVFPASMAPRPLPRPPREVIVTSLPIPGGGQVESWLYPAAGDELAPLVVYCHGNAELIDYQDPVVQGYRRHGVALLLPEYRGYGRSGGKPSEAGIVADCIRFVDVALARPEIDRSRVVFHGRSLGGGVAAQLAAQRRPAALILEETFYSLAAMSAEYYAPSFLAKHPFRTDLVLRKLEAPILIFHGTRDSVIPVEHARRLHALRPDATYVEYDSDHVEFPGDRNEAAYWDEIRRFLLEAGVIQSGG